MRMPTSNIRLRFFRIGSLLSLSTCMLAACATSPSSQPAARLEIQENVGFTITEQARISGGVRGDYENALALLEQGRHAEGITLLETVAEEAPRFSAPRIDLGIAYHQSGNLEAAERNLLHALASNPGAVMSSKQTRPRPRSSRRSIWISRLHSGHSPSYRMRIWKVSIAALPGEPRLEPQQRYALLQFVQRLDAFDAVG